MTTRISNENRIIFIHRSISTLSDPRVANVEYGEHFVVEDTGALYYKDLDGDIVLQTQVPNYNLNVAINVTNGVSTITSTNTNGNNMFIINGRTKITLLLNVSGNVKVTNYNTISKNTFNLVLRNNIGIKKVNNSAITNEGTTYPIYFRSREVNQVSNTRNSFEQEVKVCDLFNFDANNNLIYLNEVVELVYINNRFVVTTPKVIENAYNRLDNTPLLKPNGQDITYNTNGYSTVYTANEVNVNRLTPNKDYVYLTKVNNSGTDATVANQPINYSAGNVAESTFKNRKIISKHNEHPISLKYAPNNTYSYLTFLPDVLFERKVHVRDGLYVENSEDPSNTNPDQVLGFEETRTKFDVRYLNPLNTLTQNFNTLKSRVDNILGTGGTSLASSLANVRSDFTSADNTLRNAINVEKGRLDTITPKVTKLETDLRSLSSTTPNTIDNKINDFNTNTVTPIKNDLNNYKKSNDVKVTSLTSTVGEHTASIGTLNTELNALKTKEGQDVTTLTNNINNAKNELGRRIDSANSAISNKADSANPVFTISAAGRITDFNNIGYNQTKFFYGWSAVTNSPRGATSQDIGDFVGLHLASSGKALTIVGTNNQLWYRGNDTNSATTYTSSWGAWREFAFMDNKASISDFGVTKLNDTLFSDSNTEALTARAGNELRKRIGFHKLVSMDNTGTSRTLDFNSKNSIEAYLKSYHDFTTLLNEAVYEFSLYNTNSKYANNTRIVNQPGGIENQPCTVYLSLWKNHSYIEVFYHTINRKFVRTFYFLQDDQSKFPWYEYTTDQNSITTGPVYTNSNSVDYDTLIKSSTLEESNKLISTLASLENANKDKLPNGIHNHGNLLTLNNNKHHTQIYFVHNTDSTGNVILGNRGVWYRTYYSGSTGQQISQWYRLDGAEWTDIRGVPDAGLNTKGIVQLTSATNSASETLAATAKAVKTVYDLADTKVTANNAEIILNFSNNLNAINNTRFFQYNHTSLNNPGTSGVFDGIGLQIGYENDKLQIASHDNSLYYRRNDFAESDAGFANGWSNWFKLFVENDASTTSKGIVQLTSEVNNASETLAATAKAVKTTYDYAATMVPLAGTGNELGRTKGMTGPLGLIPFNFQGGTELNTRYSGFYRLNSFKIKKVVNGIESTDAIAPFHILITHPSMSDMGHARSIGLNYGPAIGVYTYSWDAKGVLSNVERLLDSSQFVHDYNDSGLARIPSAKVTNTLKNELSALETKVNGKVETNPIRVGNLNDYAYENPNSMFFFGTYHENNLTPGDTKTLEVLNRFKEVSPTARTGIDYTGLQFGYSNQLTQIMTTGGSDLYVRGNDDATTNTKENYNNSWTQWRKIITSAELASPDMVGVDFANGYHIGRAYDLSIFYKFDPKADISFDDLWGSTFIGSVRSYKMLKTPLHFSSNNPTGDGASKNMTGVLEVKQSAVDYANNSTMQTYYDENGKIFYRYGNGGKNYNIYDSDSKPSNVVTWKPWEEVLTRNLVDGRVNNYSSIMFNGYLYAESGLQIKRDNYNPMVTFCKPLLNIKDLYKTITYGGIDKEVKLLTIGDIHFTSGGTDGYNNDKSLYSLPNAPLASIRYNVGLVSDKNPDEKRTIRYFEFGHYDYTDAGETGRAWDPTFKSTYDGIHLGSGISRERIYNQDSETYQRRLLGDNLYDNNHRIFLHIKGYATTFTPDYSSWNDLVVNTKYVREVLCSMVAFFAQATPPYGWLKANGAAVSRSAYPDLFRKIGTRYGSGDGSTTFNLPDLRGEFIRGLDDGRNVDRGRALGSYQGDAMREISGNINNIVKSRTTLGTGPFTDTGTNWQPIVPYSQPGQLTSNQNTALNVYEERVVSFSAARAGIPTANEIRPRNIALLACIKY